MWTVENRKRYERSHLRYPSDLTEYSKLFPSDRGDRLRPHISAAPPAAAEGLAGRHVSQSSKVN